MLDPNDYALQQPVESNPKEYENESNNPVTVQAKSMVNKKPKILSPITLSYYQTLQSRIVFNPPPETQSEIPQTPGNSHPWNQHSWTKSLGEYGSLFGNLTPAAGQTEGNLSTWEQPPAQNLAELAFLLTEETAILQSIGSSDKGKQPALAPGKHSNTWTPISLNITSNTPPINQIMAYWNIAKLEKFSGEEDNAYSWIADAKKAITTNSWNDNRTSAEQEVNHTQAINLAINRTSGVDAKITQLNKKLTQKIEGFLARTTGTYQPPQWRENNNNSRYPQRKIMDQNQGNPYQQPRYQQNMISQYFIPQNQPPLYAQQVLYTQPLPQNYYQPPPMTQAISHYQTSPYSPSRPQAIDYNQGWRNPNNNQVQTNSGLSRPIPRSPAQSRPTPTGYPNQASYLGLTKDQGFDKSTPVEKEDIERISQPSKQTKSNIPPATFTENTTLATIFPFDIDNLNTHSLFSRAAIN
ncbi:hypothetical protein G9A89_023802 [Geosiphon pyriformis]|nr:hypothetical protein G9A89_023802 [Geosiphon pyriformis]